jgi:hypothetical protein
VKKFLLAASAVALAQVTAPARAQMNMPGMQMPGPEQKSSAPKKAAQPKAKTQSKAAPYAQHGEAKTSVMKAAEPVPSDHEHMDHGTMPMPPSGGAANAAAPVTMPAPEARSGPAMPMRTDHADQSNMNDMPGMEHGGAHGGHEMSMAGALGPYPMNRESSGTAWQPDTSEHAGIHVMSGDWTLMAHGMLNLVYDHQSGPRGDDKAFVSGMLMGMARRPVGNGTLQFKAMVSPDPLMGPSGYPLLLASGETANGRDRLIDRQHPHDFLMELSASISQNFGKEGSVFLYGGLPGEPAFGPPAFMHREAIEDSPEAPISHHWLDSTHISFGVVTAGLVLGNVKAEVSRFNGREPDQHRWNIETGPLDSTSVRLSWNPTRTLSLQGSWGHFTDPEQLEPGVDQKRWSASALWADEIAPGWKAATTLAWGRKTAHGHTDDAADVEASIKHALWTVFARGEMAENRELTDVEDGPVYRVGKISLGVIRDFRIADHLLFGPGALFAVNFVPDGLASAYGGKSPTGMMAFVRLKID